jgi:hypothetical protein
VEVGEGCRELGITEATLHRLRSELLDAHGDRDFLSLLKWLKKEKNCEPALYVELTRTPTLRQKM